MEEGLESLCSKISLTDGERVGIKVVEGDVAEIREKSLNCLVGKLWTERPINKEAFQTVLSRLWRTVGQVIFRELQDNCWLFEFSGDSDKQRVLAGRPWSYDRFALVLKEFDGKIALSQMDFMHTPIWVQVHDMPLLCMNRGVGVKIGASLGTVEDVDVAGDGAGWGRCLRLRVVINLGKPLERGRALEFGGRSHWVSFKYEKLPMCCFQCGRVVHDRPGCPVRKSQRLHTDDKEKQWGSWIRADGPQRNRNVNGNTGGWSTNSGADSDSDSGRRTSTPAENSTRAEGHIVGRGLARGGERGAECEVTRGVDCGGQSGTVRGVDSAGVLPRLVHGGKALSGGVQKQLVHDKGTDSVRGVSQKQAQNVGLKSVRGAQPPLPQNMGVTCMDDSPDRGFRGASQDNVADEGSYVAGMHGVDAGLGAKLSTLSGSAPTPTGQGSPSETATSSAAPSQVARAPLNQRNSSLRGWKRQARAGATTDKDSFMGGGHKRKPVDGVPGGRKGAQEKMKRGKTVHVFSLRDTEELAEADIQLRQQP
jgi:hypothetical protein